MSKDFTSVEGSLDKKLQLRHTPITQKIDNFVLQIGEFFNWFWVILVAVIILNVVLRYVFKNGMIELEELQWHLYCIGWLVGLSSTYIVDSHVRVDVLSERLSYRKKLWFELFGILILFLPFVILVLYYAVPFFELSWTSSERSTSANGLPARWFVKGFLVISFFLLLISGCVSKDMSDLERQVSSIMSTPGGRLDPLPEIKPYEAYIYESGKLNAPNPFRRFWFIFDP